MANIMKLKRTRLSAMEKGNVKIAPAHLFCENVKDRSVEARTPKVNTWSVTAHEDQLVPVVILISV